MQHLSYELCLELKTAGFPQELKEEVSRCVYYDTQKTIVVAVTEDAQLLEGFVKIPNLEELIEGCGMAFNSLERDRNESWIADAEAGYTYHQMWIGEGITPKEAVARLWLQIHGK